MTSRHRLLFALTLAAATAAFTGCGRQTRGNADAMGQSKAAAPSEGGATSTAGSAGTSENFGNLDRKKQVDEASPARRSDTGGASTGPDYSLDRTTTPSGQPTQSRQKVDESNNTSPRSP